MRDALVLMHARNIQPCLESIWALDIPVIYMKGYTEYQIMQEAWPQVMEHDFDWLWLASDDLVITPAALEAVRTIRDSGVAPVVTGFSQFSFTDWRVNLTGGELQRGGSEQVWRHFADVVKWPELALATWFTGMSLTGMSRDLWRKFPFQVDGDPGWQSDLKLSLRLEDAVIPIVAARDGFCLHWRHDRTYGVDHRDAASHVNLVSRRVWMEDRTGIPREILAA